VCSLVHGYWYFGRNCSLQEAHMHTCVHLKVYSVSKPTTPQSENSWSRNIEYYHLSIYRNTVFETASKSLTFRVFRFITPFWNYSRVFCYLVSTHKQEPAFYLRFARNKMHLLNQTAVYLLK